jgi:hypothetical protein
MRSAQLKSAVAPGKSVNTQTFRAGVIQWTRQFLRSSSMTPYPLFAGLMAIAVAVTGQNQNYGYGHGGNRGNHGGDYNGGHGHHGGDRDGHGGRNADVVLYEHGNYEGRFVRINSDIANLSTLGLNDAASSIRITSGTWEVCEHANYQGRCQIINASQAGILMNDRISSLRRVDDSRGNTHGGGYNNGNSHGGDRGQGGNQNHGNNASDNPARS